MKPLTYREKKLLGILREAVMSGRGRIDSDDQSWIAEDYARFRRRLLVELRRPPHFRRETP
jgi:hypothetical protein